MNKRIAKKVFDTLKYDLYSYACYTRYPRRFHAPAIQRMKKLDRLERRVVRAEFRAEAAGGR